MCLATSLYSAANKRYRLQKETEKPLISFNTKEVNTGGGWFFFKKKGLEGVQHKSGLER